MNNSPAQAPEGHLVFVHGGGVGPWMWRAQKEFLEGRFHIHTPVLPGHSPTGSGRYTTHADAALHVAEQINLDALQGDVRVIGFSVGGQVAMELAAAHPDRVAGTVIVSSVVQSWRHAASLAALAAAAAPLARLRSFARAQAKQLYVGEHDFEAYFELSRAMHRESLRNLMHANFSFRVPAAFTRSTHPALLLAGENEQKAMITNLERMARELPNGRFESVAGVAHGIPMAAAAEFNELLSSWLGTPGTENG